MREKLSLLEVVDSFHIEPKFQGCGTLRNKAPASAGFLQITGDHICSLERGKNPATGCNCVHAREAKPSRDSEHFHLERRVPGVW